jgi:hypothetical protein
MFAVSVAAKAIPAADISAAATDRCKIDFFNMVLLL